MLSEKIRGFRCSQGISYAQLDKYADEVALLEQRLVQCECGHARDLHDDSGICRALVMPARSCQCLKFKGFPIPDPMLPEDADA